jgi:two-component system autoinducer 2 sensor kinase/phosphatase LuxQ
VTNSNSLPLSLQNWLNHWPDAIILVDETLSVRFYSTPAQQLLAWPESEILGRSLHSIVCIQNREFSHEQHECPLSISRFSSGENYHSSVWSNADGDYIPIDYRLFSLALPELDETLYAVNFHSTLNDEYNQYELEKLAEYTNANPSPIVELDVEGNILFANPAFQEKLLDCGFSKEGLSNFLPLNIKSICASVASTQASITDIERTLDEQVFRWHFHPISGKESFSLLAYGFDITQQKSAEKRIAGERAAARRDFYAKMLHELRTPLNAIVGFSDLLVLRSGNFDDKERERLNAIKTAGLQLNDLITDTLDLSKIEAGKLSASPTVTVLSKVFKDLNVQMGGLAEVKSLNYKYDIEPGLQMFIDAQKLRQILMNLISNSIKYTKNGWVHLQVSAKVDAELGDAIEFRVSDSGIGIPADKIDTLFMSYTQVEDEETRDVQGTGLGLALVEQFVLLLKGHIRLESEHGQGSCFILCLPVDYNSQP